MFLLSSNSESKNHHFVGTNFLCSAESIQDQPKRSWRRNWSWRQRYTWLRTGKLPISKCLQFTVTLSLFDLKVSAEASMIAATEFFLSWRSWVWCSRGLTHHLAVCLDGARTPSSTAFKEMPATLAERFLRDSLAKEGELTRWWQKKPWRYSTEINALLTAVLFGTAAVLSIGQSKSEPFENCTTFPSLL